MLFSSPSLRLYLIKVSIQIAIVVRRIRSSNFSEISVKLLSVRARALPLKYSEDIVVPRFRSLRSYMYVYTAVGGRVIRHVIRVKILIWWIHPTFRNRGTAYNSRSFAGNLLFVADFDS
jgi:hypothetical protein